MPTYKTVKELTAYVETQAVIFLEQAKKKVENLVREYIQRSFYDAYNPKVYERTYQLLNSVTSTNVSSLGDGRYEVIIYLDYDNVPYGYYDYANDIEIERPAEEVFRLASQGYHGDTIHTQGKFMENAKNDLLFGESYDIIKDFVAFMKSKGITVKESGMMIF